MYGAYHGQVQFVFLLKEDPFLRSRVGGLRTSPAMTQKKKGSIAAFSVQYIITFPDSESWTKLITRVTQSSVPFQAFVIKFYS
jgi:hypothetical protein